MYKIFERKKSILQYKKISFKIRPKDMLNLSNIT
jgi:hypothetical protein